MLDGRRPAGRSGRRRAAHHGGRRAARRGLSTSASLLIVFVGLFLALGSLYTATANTGERLADARDDQRERQRAVAQTQVTVVTATWDVDAGTLRVEVNNTGERTLSVHESDTVLDGSYVPIDAYERVTVADRETSVWRPGEQLVLEDDNTVSSPGRVRFVTGPGVADAREVVDV